MIKKYNLDPSLIAWIMTETGIGPGIGDVHYLVPVGSSVSNYYEWLKTDMRVPPAKIHHTPAGGYNALTANRNDVLLVFPGSYTIDSTLTWAKAQTHMLGVGNPTWRQGGKIRIQTETEAVDATIDVTGSGVFFGGFNITNSFDAITNLTALRISSTYFAANKLDLRGQLQSNQISGINTSSLEFAAGSSYGFGSTFKDCNFGTASQTSRTGKNGIIYFAPSSIDGSQSGYLRFIRCSIEGKAEIATVPMVLLNNSLSTDRYVLFKDCFFYNHWVNKAGKLAAAFDFTSMPTSLSSGVIVLDGCSGYGIEEWYDDIPRTGYIVSTDGNNGLASAIYG